MWIIYWWLLVALWRLVTAESAVQTCSDQWFNIATRVPVGANNDDAAMEDKNDNDDDAGACRDNRYGTATLALGNPNLEKTTLNWGEALVSKICLPYFQFVQRS